MNTTFSPRFPVLLTAYLFAAILFHSAPATAQDEAENQEKAEAVTASNSEVPVDQLRLMLDPLTKDELLVEAEAWRDLVKAKVQEISDREIESRKISSGDPDPGAAPEEKTAVLAQLTKLREQSTALLERFETVLQGYETKGGDPAEFRQYAGAVSGIKVDVKDVSATWSAIVGWLTSKEGGIKWGLNILKFLGIVFAFWILSKFVSRVIRKALSMSKLTDLLKDFINNLVARTILVVGILVALSTIGFNVGALLALIGGGAFIVGFALQDTLGNFAAGMMLLIYRPFDVGDAVEVGGVNGKVDKVSLVTTTIRTFDNKVVLVPNKKVWGEVITNASASEERRVDLIFGIGYEDDAAQAQHILERLTTGHERVLAEPAPTIKLHELADSSVNFICRPWVKTPDYWAVYWDLTRTVKEAFDDEGISIPYPQQDIHLYPAEKTAEKPEIGAKDKAERKPSSDENSTPDAKGISPNDDA